MGRQMRFHTAYSIHAKAFLWPERGGPGPLFRMLSLRERRRFVRRQVAARTEQAMIVDAPVRPRLIS
jgi:hypothetical protein